MAGWFSVYPNMLPLDCMHACSHYCVVLFFIVFALPSGHSCTRLLPPSSSWIWRQFHLNFGILTFGYCLLEIHLICAVSTLKLIQQKPFLPEVVCGICGKVDNTVSLLGSASLCFFGVFQGCHVSRVLFEFHSCLWLPWEDSKCPEFSKGAFPDFWRTNKPVCNPVICGLRWPYLPFVHHLESAVAKLCAAPTLRSPVYYRRLLLCQCLLRTPSQSTRWKEKEPWRDSGWPKSLSFLCISTQTSWAKSKSHGCPFAPQARIYVLQECAGNIWKTANICYNNTVRPGVYLEVVTF